MKQHNIRLLLIALLLALGANPSKAKILSSDRLVEFTAPPDTIKPSISLLGIDTVITPLKADYNDPPIALMDNVDSDSAMRPYLNMRSTLPIGFNGKLFCDQPGYFKMTYFVKDLAGNLSDTAIRVVYCDGSTSIFEQAAIGDFISFGLNTDNKNIHINILSFPNQRAEIGLVDAYGREIASPVFQNSKTEFVLEYKHVPSGIYLVYVKFGATVFVRKVILN